MFEYSSRPGAPLRNRTVDLLLTIATPHRPGRTACTDRTPERTRCTGCTQCSRDPVHDSFHDQPAAPGYRATLSDGAQVTLGDGAAIAAVRRSEPGPAIGRQGLPVSRRRQWPAGRRVGVECEVPEAESYLDDAGTGDVGGRAGRP